MILPYDFHQPGLALREQREIFHQVEQPRPVARAAQHHLQRHPSRLVLALDAFPLEEPLPIRRERTDAAVRAVRGDEQRVEPEELRNLGLVVRQVFIERRARGHAGLLQLDDHQRQAVDEADQIRAAGVERARDAELAKSNSIRCFTFRQRFLGSFEEGGTELGEDFNRTPGVGKPLRLLSLPDESLGQTRTA